MIGIYSIVKGDFRPQRMTRFLIFLITLLFVGTLFAQGDRNGIFIALAQLFGGGIIFLLSIKKGIGGYGKLDFIVLFLTIASLVVWKTTDNPTLGLFMSIFTDIIAFTPTIIKTWQLPHTEEWKFYMSDVVASFFSILSIQMYSMENLVFPIYIFCINTLSVVMILGRRKFFSRKEKVKYSCICCGYKTLSEQPPGTYDICEICGWEDSDSDDEANNVTLKQAKKNVKKYGVSDPKLGTNGYFIKKPTEKDHRDPKWETLDYTFAQETGEPSVGVHN